MGDFEGWAQKIWGMLQNPETAILVLGGLIALSLLGAIVGLLTRKFITLIVLAAIVYALMLYGDDIKFWFERTFNI